MTSNTQILTAFNNHFEEFVDDIVRAFPDDIEIATAANALKKLRKANPRLIIVIFKEHVLAPYGEKLMAGDLSYFIEKDYTEDVEGSAQAGPILEKIQHIKGPFALMDATEKDKVLKYMQNLCKLSSLYN
jgi:hypothetical protein